MLIHSLYEGSYSVDTSKEFIPFDPEIHHRKDRPASLFIHVHPFVVETASGLVVLDTGLGYNTEEGEPVIHKNFHEAGLDPSDVRYVLMSHLHKDHAGGMVIEQNGSLEPAFSNAEYVIQRGEWDDVFAGSPDSEGVEALEVLQRSGNLLLVENDGILTHEIYYERSGGHKEHHQVFHIQTAGEHIFFGGDEAPEPEQFFRSFVAKYDFDGKKSRDLRAQYWEQGRKEGWIFLLYHSTNIAIGRPELRSDGSHKLIEAFN